MKVLVLHPADARPTNPKFQDVLNRLNTQVVEVARAEGHEPTLVASELRSFDEHRPLIDAADAVVIMGGEDVVPSHYGGNATYESQTEHVPLADAAQLEAIRYCIEQRIPLLGICRGLQLLNVACDGDLVQHMADPAPHREREGDEKFFPMKIRVLADAGLRDDLPAVFMGRCSHHQAVLTPGEGLEIAAVSSDGCIEALAHANAPATGVQWHPEHPDVASDHLPPLLARLQRQADARVASTPTTAATLAASTAVAAVALTAATAAIPAAPTAATSAVSPAPSTAAAAPAAEPELAV